MKHVRSFILGGLLVSALAFAGTGNIPQIVTNIIQRAHVNDIRSALYQDLVPRNSSGTTTTLGGSLGTSTYLWLKARIAAGYWALGDIKEHHTYNGAAPIDEGWMLMDGRQITQANYDTEHGSGHWATYVGSSTLLNKYLPSMAAKYLVGSATTTQDGSAPITTTGNSGNTININHGHSSVTTAREAWYKSRTGTNIDQTIDEGLAGYSNIQAGSIKNSISILVGNTTSINGTVPGLFFPLQVDSTTNDFDLYTGGSASGTTGTSLSASQNIQPESIQVQYYMRVID